MKISEVARKALEREKALKATMNEQIRKAVEELVSSRLQSLSQPAANISLGSARCLGRRHQNRTLGVDDCERNCFSIIMYCI
jgi:hypothetical protein